MQICAGQIAGVEAAIHFMREAFSSEDCEAVLLVDASNAFNSLNRECIFDVISHLFVPLWLLFSSIPKKFQQLN